MDREENTPFGLTSQEVAERVEKGQVNKADISTGKKGFLSRQTVTFLRYTYLRTETIALR